MYQSHEFYLRRAIEISKEAREAGNTPFGALLVNKEGEIIMEQGNIEITGENLYRARGSDTCSKSIS